LDGFQGQNRDIIENATIEIAALGEDKSQTLHTTRTNEQGYFNLQVNDKNHNYRINKIVLNEKVQVPAPIPDPQKTKGRAGFLYILFSSSRSRTNQVIDLGQTVIILKKGGKLAIERSLGERKSILDFSSSSPVKFEEGTFGSVGLEHYSENGSGEIVEMAKKALLDERNYQAALKEKKKGDSQKSKNPEAAKNYYTRALDRYPRLSEAYMALARLYEQAGDAKKKVETLKAGIGLCPWSQELKRELGRTYYANKEYSATIKILGEYLKTAPSDLSAVEILTSALADAGKRKKASNIWKRTCGISKNQSCLIYAGDFHRKNKYLIAAISYYRRYKAKKPKDDWAAVYLAKGYFAMGRTKDAIGSLKTRANAFVYYYGAKAAEEYRDYKWARSLTSWAIKRIGDGTLKKSVKDLVKEKTKIKHLQEKECRWVLYLMSIQADNDYKNWKGPPYTMYRGRHGKGLTVDCLKVLARR